MSQLLRCVSLLGLVLLFANCGKEKPALATSPTTLPVTQTRIINVTGNLAFGNVNIGSSGQMTMTISNSGNAPLTFTGMNGPGGSAVTVSSTSGTVAAGGSLNVTWYFRPTTSGSFSGIATVNGDQTSGNNTLAISGNGVAGFSGTWTGAHTITACNGTGSAQDLICSAARGSNKVGSSLNFSTTLNQSGNLVTGTANLGGITGPVTGTVTNNTLTLAGTLTSAGGYSLVITGWSTTVSGSSMTGTVNYTLTFQGVPGFAGIVASVGPVNRQ